MIIEHISEKLINVDLNVTCLGKEKCSKGHYYGPAIREYYLIHYVVKGKGIFKIGNKTFNIEKGMGFLIEPENLTYYKANDDDPWEYVWIGFTGTKAKKYMEQIMISSENPIFRLEDNNALEKWIDEVLYCIDLKVGRDLLLQSCLYKFLYFLTNELYLNEQKKIVVGSEKYVEEGITYIINNYQRGIGIDDVTKYLNINRTYLHRLFKKYVNNSPQQFLINYRIDRACDLLKNNNLTVGDVGRSVGYEDVLLFSRAFKKHKGSSPREYRERLLNY